MKKLIFTLFCLAVTMQFSFGQAHVPFNQFSGSNSLDSTLVNSSINDTVSSSFFLTPICGILDPVTSYPYVGNFVAGKGYANGTNSNNDKEKMEKYRVPAQAQIGHIFAVIYNATSNPNDTVFAVLHNHDGSINSTTNGVDLATIYNGAVYPNYKNQTGNFAFAVFDFNGPIPIYHTDSMYVGITIPTISGDSIAVGSSPNTCNSAGQLAWEKRSDNSYHPFSAAWGLNVDFMIFPIYEINTSLDTSALSTGVTLNGLTINAAYPNPTNSSVNLNYAIDQSTNVRVEIYNTLGQQVKAESLGNENPGKYTQNIDMSHLTKGTYFYSIITDNSRLFGQIEVQ